MLCFGCFKEKNNTGACPECGYDPQSDAGKYSTALQQGSILHERYIVGRVLGQGGFGITYAALDFATQQRVAIKEFLPTSLASRTVSGTVSPYGGQMEEHFTQGKAGFLEEAHTLEQFKDNAHTVNVQDYFEENGTAYFVMDYVQGQNLKSYVKIMGGKLGEEAANRILMPIMEALGDVHAKGIVHRDIAPDNIIVNAEGSATLIDFGAARYSTGEKSMSLDVVLKHGYAPMEQYSHRSRQGPYTDVYAMAATYYYAVTGKVPPDAIERMAADSLVPPSKHGVKLSSHTEAALMKALSLQAEDRFANMEEFLKALKGEIQPETKKKQKPEKKKGGKVFAVIALLIVVVLGGAAGFLFGRGGSKESAAVTGELLPEAEPTAIVISEAEPTPEPTPEPIPEPTPEPESAFLETVIYDGSGVKITATKFTADSNGFRLYLHAENNNAEAISLSSDIITVNDCLTVNDAHYWIDLEPGAAGERILSLPRKDIEEAGIEYPSKMAIRVGGYNDSFSLNMLSELVEIPLYKVENSLHTLSDEGKVFYEDGGVKLAYKGLRSGRLLIYVENNSDYYVNTCYSNHYINGIRHGDEYTSYGIGTVAPHTVMQTTLYFWEENQEILVDESSTVELEVDLSFFDGEGNWVNSLHSEQQRLLPE